MAMGQIIHGDEAASLVAAALQLNARLCPYKRRSIYFIVA